MKDSISIGDYVVFYSSAQPRVGRVFEIGTGRSYFKIVQTNKPIAVRRKPSKIISVKRIQSIVEKKSR